MDSVVILFCEFCGLTGVTLPLCLSPSMFLCYLVLLKAHLKISRLCKWALRRLKKGITELCWAARVAVVRGRLAQPRTVRGNVALFTNSSSKQLPGFRDY